MSYSSTPVSRVCVLTELQLCPEVSLCLLGVRACQEPLQHTGSSPQRQDHPAGVSRRHTVHTLGNSEEAAAGGAQDAWAQNRGAETAAFQLKPRNWVLFWSERLKDLG